MYVRVYIIFYVNILLQLMSSRLRETSRCRHLSGIWRRDTSVLLVGGGVAVCFDW